MRKNRVIVFFLSIFLLFSVFQLNADAAESLSDRKEAAANDIYECLLAFDTYVDISEYNIPYSDRAATEIYDKALDKDLYLFNVLGNVTDFSNGDGFCSAYIDDGCFLGFEFDYQGYSAETLKKQYSKLESKVASIAKSLKLSSLSDEWAVLAVHDYIALHCDYDEANKPKRACYTAYGALVNESAICSGYSTACELLLDYIGIPSTVVTSDAMDHAWNMVKLNGKWYHMDITWDDPYPEKKNYVSYQYFLKTDKEFKKHKKMRHYGWTSSVKSTSTTYSKIPKTDNNSLYHQGKYWYYAAKNKNGTYTYYRYNFKFTSKKKLFTSTLKPVKYQSRIYYTAKKNRISSANINGTVKRTIKKLSATSRMTSLKVKNNRVYYKYKKGKKTKSASFKLTAAMKKTK